MVVIAFRTRVREGVDEQELGRVGMRMYELASGMPGYVSYRRRVLAVLPAFTAELGPVAGGR